MKKEKLQPEASQQGQNGLSEIGAPSANGEVDLPTTAAGAPEPIRGQPDDRGTDEAELEEGLDTTAAFEQLQQLLVGQQKSDLEALSHRLDEEKVGPDELSQWLPLAVRKAANRDGNFAAALGPTMANSFQDSVKRNPKALADAISPIMGPAIRRSISQAISGMIQSLNQTVEHSFSWSGLKWRWQAFKTNRPFAEVVLLNAFVYRVEQIFLIHRDDGSLLAHADASGVSGADADLVSGMLTAIQDFVQQSFGASEDDAVESMRVGDHHVWILPSPHALMAAVIRGVPPMELREDLFGELEKIHEETSEYLNDYQGDNTPFEMIVPRLESCLYSEARNKESNQPSAKRIVLPIVILLLPLLLAGWGAYWGGSQWLEGRRSDRVLAALQAPDSAELTYDNGVVNVVGQAKHDWIERSRRLVGMVDGLRELNLEALHDLDQAWLAYVDQLREEPGIVVADAKIDGDRYHISGLRDPLAVDPGQLLNDAGLDPNVVRSSWEPYRSLDPRFENLRVINRAPSHPGVTWKRLDGRLVATGSAPSQWFDEATTFMASVEDITVDIRSVENRDEQALASELATLQDVFVPFEKDSSQVRDVRRTEIVDIARRIARLRSAGRLLGKSFDVIVVGYMDSSETAQSSTLLARERANQVWKVLAENGAGKSGLFVRNGAKLTAKQNDGDYRGCAILVEQRN